MVGRRTEAPLLTVDDCATGAALLAGVPVDDAATGVCVEQVMASVWLVVLSKLHELITFAVTMNGDDVVLVCARAAVIVIVIIIVVIRIASDRPPIRIVQRRALVMAFIAINS